MPYCDGQGIAACGKWSVRDAAQRARIEDVDLVIARTRNVEPLARLVNGELPGNRAGSQGGASRPERPRVEHVDLATLFVAHEERIASFVERDADREGEVGAAGDHARRGGVSEIAIAAPGLAKGESAD